MIRRATPDDAPALSALARECFTQTFGHLYTAEDLTAFLDQAYSPAVLRAELEDPEYATWLLFEDAPGSPSQEDEAGSLAHVSSGSPSTINANERHDAASPDTARAGEGTQASSPERSPIGYVTACPAHLPHPDVAPGGSACGARITARSVSTHATASRSSASTRSWSATTRTVSSSPAARVASKPRPRVEHTPPEGRPSTGHARESHVASPTQPDPAASGTRHAR